MKMGIAGGVPRELTLRRGLACRLLAKEELWEQYLGKEGTEVQLGRGRN